MVFKITIIEIKTNIIEVETGTLEPGYYLEGVTTDRFKRLHTFPDGMSGVEVADGTETGSCEVIPPESEFVQTRLAWWAEHPEDIPDWIDITLPGEPPMQIKQVEIDMGIIPISSKTFTIVDADISATTKITGSIAMEDTEDKDADECDMDDLVIVCASGIGQFIMNVSSLSGSVYGHYKINYIIGGS
jgi:hypothetical protein